MIYSPSLVFCETELAIDAVLLSSKQKQLDHKHDQRALRGHVEAEREAEDRDDDFVERNDKHVHDVAEQEPYAEMRQHQVGGFPPMRFFVRSIHCASLPSPVIKLHSHGCRPGDE